MVYSALSYAALARWPFELFRPSGPPSLANLADLLFPPICCVCAAPGVGRLDLCAGCYRDLPRSPQGRRQAGSCVRCAEPLPAGTAGAPPSGRHALADAGSAGGDLPEVHGITGEQGAAHLCVGCQRRRPAFDAVITPFRYAPPVNNLIRELKFAGKLPCGRLLGTLLARHLLHRDRAIHRAIDRIIPVPLHPSRARERGFNQAMELAHPVSRALGIPMDHRCVRRIRRTATQSDLSRDARSGNVRHAFRVMSRVKGLRLAVVDDVVTTTSTAGAIALALKRAGAARVEIWAVARAGQEPARTGQGW